MKSTGTTSDALPLADREMANAHLADLEARFPRYPDPSVLRHHALTHLTNTSLIRRQEIPYEVAEDEIFHVRRTYCLTHDGIAYLAYEGESNERLVVFGTVYHLFLGLWNKVGGLDWKYPHKTVLGYRIDTGGLARRIGQAYRRERARSALTRWKSGTNMRNVALLFGFIPNLGHHIWNEQTGLEYLLESNLLDSIDSVIIGHGDYFNTEGWFLDRGNTVARRSGIYASRVGYTTADILIRSTELVFTDSTRKRVKAWRELPNLARMRLITQLEPRSPVLGIQLRQHSRRWLGEVDGVIALIRAVHVRYPNSAFVIDGFSRAITPSAADEASMAFESLIFERILEATAGDTLLTTTIGLGMSEKLALLERTDLVVSPIGSGGVITHWLLQKPMVSYGPPSYYEWTAQDSNTLVESPAESVLFVPTEQIQMDANQVDYDFQWTALIPLVDSLLRVSHAS